MFPRLLFLATLVQWSFSSDPSVQLPNGSIVGRAAVTVQNTPYFVFEGIPYATPPVGNLRFQAPQPPQNWKNTLNVTYSNVACYQISDHLENESEDCLYLNVYTSKVSDTEDLLPVMVFIHGGGFIGGTGYQYKSEYLIDGGVILVTFNYRLGVFGFLSTGDEVILGNNGLKDQTLALKWVSNNIKLFGGDPNQITMFGESAGATSVAYQLLNLNSEGLFRGAILQSGTFLNPIALQRNPRQVAFSTAALLNDTIDENITTQKLREILQEVDAANLNAAGEQYFNTFNHEWSNIAVQDVPWAPVIENEHSEAFLTEKMFDMLTRGHFLKVPIIIGFNSEEAILYNQDPDLTAATVAIVDDHLDLLVPFDMQISDLGGRTRMGLAIRDIYTGGKNFSSRVGDAIRYTSDNFLTRPAIKHAELSSKFVRTYFYQFSYDGEFGNIDTHYEGAETVGHTEDLYYLFCFESPCSTEGIEEDLLTRHRLVKLWTNFAKYLTPTPEEDELLQKVIWPEMSGENEDFVYLDIGKNLEIKNKPKEKTYKEWIKLYESLGLDSFDTY